jgi:hypothetical protein
MEFWRRLDVERYCRIADVDTSAPVNLLSVSMALLEQESFAMAKGLSPPTANSIPFPRSPPSVSCPPHSTPPDIPMN